MKTPQKLLLFLHKLAARHLSNYGVLSRGFLSLSEGKEADLTGAFFPDDKMRLAAHLLSVVGQDTTDDRAAMLARACSVAIETATDKNAESLTQLVEALEVLADNDPETGYTIVPAATVESLPPKRDDKTEVINAATAALNSVAENIGDTAASFAGTECSVVTRGNRDFYTFRGRAAYPAEMTIGANKFRLTNASYRAGTYQKL